MRAKIKSKGVNMHFLQNFNFAHLGDMCVCSMFPKSTHETFSQKLYQIFKDHKRFVKPKLARSDFSILHYAGEVTLVPEFCCKLLLLSKVGVH